jgi:PAS domain S-box-containing protein
MGRFWVMTNNGFNLMDRARGTFTRYLHDANDPFSLADNILNLSAVYEDSDGTLWIGTRSSGVDRLPRWAKKFTSYRHNPQDSNSLSSNVVSGLAVSPTGELWIGTAAGVDRWNGKTFTHYLANADDPASVSPGAQHVAIDSRGIVWAGSYGGGLNRLDRSGVKRFRHDPGDPDSPANDNIASLAPDAAGGLWFSVHGKGMDYFDGRRFTHFDHDPSDPGSLPDRWVQPFLLDRHGKLWIGTVSMGLVGLETETGKFTTHLLDPKQASNQAVNWVQDIYYDGTRLWVASIIGLFCFDLASSSFTGHYTENDGAASNSMVAVIGDAQANIWVSTTKGLSRFDPRTKKFRNYDAYDGLQGNEFYPATRAKAADGRLFFGGPTGVTVFHPLELVDNQTPPPVVLTEFELFNGPAKIGGKDSPLQRAINISSDITLRHWQSVFRFQFAALDFTAPKKNRYAYKLEPFDEDWQYTDATRRWATYTNLDPGDYTFRVKASNNDGIWNEQGVTLHIRILPPWWNTPWFRALCTAAVLALLWSGYRYRVQELQRESRQLRDMIETIPAMAWTARPDGSSAFVNRQWAEFTGLYPEDAAGSGWTDAVHPEDRQGYSEKWRASVATGEPFECEARFRRAGDQAYRWLLARAVPLRDKHDNIRRWYGTLTDVEDRKRAEIERHRRYELEADLAHINRVSMMGELAASVAHEVNQPLSGIVSNGSACLRWLAGAQPDLDEIRNALRDMVQDGKRAGDIIAGIRAMTKRATSPGEKLDLNQTVREVLALVADEAKRSNVTVRTRFASGLWAVSGDRVQLQQVTLNLAMNAIEAMRGVDERPRELVITTQNVEPDEVQVSVEDSGPGLDPNTAGKIFNAFHTTKASGMGLGLSISRSILHNHGGRVWASAKDSPGAIFHFSVPKYREVPTGRGEEDPI